MITKIVASNYKSLGPDTPIDLGRLTVLVGQNGAGKSNIVDLFRFISDAMKMGLEGAITKRHGIKAVRRWGNGKPYDIAIRVEIKERSGYEAIYEFVIAGSKKHDYTVKSEFAHIKDPLLGETTYHIEKQVMKLGPPGINPTLTPLSLALLLISGDERFAPLEQALRNMAIYNIFPDTLREPQKYDPAKPMNEHGSNWTSLLKDQDPDTWKDDLVAALYKLTGDIDDVEVVQLTGYLIARFRHGNSGESQKAKWFEASQESDGTLRVAGIISALLQPDLPLIGIEEPELTIHPGAIQMVYDYLLQASRHSQILVTTHSPELLDAINDPAQIRVVSRSKEMTIVETIAEDQKEAVNSDSCRWERFTAARVFKAPGS